MPCEVSMPEYTDRNASFLSGVQSVSGGVGWQGIKILVAGDNDSNYSLLRHILKDYDLTRVDNGAEAVDKVRNGKFSLVLMDMKMPVMGGLETTRKIREFDAEIPIVALAANAFDADRASALDAGCNAFLAKPLKKSQLLGLFSMNWSVWLVLVCAGSVLSAG